MAGAFEKATDLEEKLTGAISAQLPPTPPGLGFPALRVTDLDIGLPHAHSHPPNLTPPNPVPVPLPSMGPVISIPFLSGAQSIFIEGAPAARCGDLGLGMVCGGFFPMFEVFLGSSSVWFEGARQGRMAVDITKHCIFTSPRPSDPPIGPMLGSTVKGATKTLIGGFPMPSLTALGVGLAFKGLFKGLGAVLNRLKARVVVAKFLATVSVHGDEAFQKALTNDLKRIARTKTGRKLLGELSHSGQKLEIHAPNSKAVAADFATYGDHCLALNPTDAHVKVVADPNGAHVADFGNGPERVSIAGPADGSGSRVTYNPDGWPSPTSPGTPSDVVLAHELNHANNNALGRGSGGLTDPDPTWNDKWANREEAQTVGVENSYRDERGGVPQRDDYSVLP